MTSTFDRLMKILMKTYSIDPAMRRPDVRLDQLDVDSLGVGLMLFDVEDEFGIKFSRDPGPLETVGDVVRYIDAVILEQQHPASLDTTSLSPS